MKKVNTILAGTRQLLRVPYDLHAKMAKSVTNPKDRQDTTTVDLLAQPAIVGDLRAGGVVFWVDPKDNTHGLVCAIEDQSSDIRWGTSAITGASATVVGAGEKNTMAIIGTNYNLVETSYAAGLARAYRGGGFEDWFLPSNKELHEMYQKAAVIDNIAVVSGGVVLFKSGNYYWSSSELSPNKEYAWTKSFGTGDMIYWRKYKSGRVRAVRYF